VYSYDIIVINTRTRVITTISYSYRGITITYVTGPAKIGHVGSQNLTTFQTSGSHNF